MSWPPSLPATGFKSEGTTTNFSWGTDGFEVGAMSNYIVKSVRVSERVEMPVIENGSGLTAVQVLLMDGVDYELTVVDNTAVTPPIAGTVSNLIIPNLGVNGAVNPNIVAMLVVNTSVSSARKQEGERIIHAKQFVLFTPS